MKDSKIILVGNGDKVFDRQAGKEIDGFDEVVRFNNFRTKGFEDHVGRKTTVWATRICETIERRNPNQFDRILGVVNNCRFTPAIETLRPKFQLKYPKMEVIEAAKVKGYADKFNYNPQNNWLSVGMITLLFLLESYEVVYLYGFGGDRPEHKQHYFGTRTRGQEFHRWDLEWDYLSELEKENRVVKI